MPKPKLRGKHAKCGLADCRDEHRSLYSLPTACGATRGEWLRFLQCDQGGVAAPPDPVPSAASSGTVVKTGGSVFLCGSHFAADCFVNEGQYRAGFASKLLIKDGSIPTIRDPAATAGSSQRSPRLKHVVCQTDPPASRTVATQLSLRTLQNHFRSTGTQVSSGDLGSAATTTGPLTSPQLRLTSAPTKRPAKRPHLDLDEEEEEEEEGSFSVEGPQAQDSTYSPAHTAPALTEPTDVSHASSPVQNIPKYIVYETCLLELFEVCPVCKRECEVRTGRLGTFLAVDQLCPHCQYFRQWKSQPAVGSTPAGSLQAIYFTGASFYKLEEVHGEQATL